MGTITQRARKDGSIGYTAQVRMMRAGKVHTEAKTFDRRSAAAAWLKKREQELSEPGAFESAQKEDPTLKEAIGRYIRESKRAIGRTKAQVLKAIQDAPIGAMHCSEVDSRAVVSFAQGLGVQPQTVGNYISHLAPIFSIARPAWGTHWTSSNWRMRVRCCKSWERWGARSSGIAGQRRMSWTGY